MTLKMDGAALAAFTTAEFPQAGDGYRIDALSMDGITVSMDVDDSHIRPGGTVSGPTMFALVDVTMYLLVLSRIGPQALAVTTNCSIDFMRKPGLSTLSAKARVLKLGRSLCVGEVHLYSNGTADPVARANLTYALPQSGP